VGSRAPVLFENESICVFEVSALSWGGEYEKRGGGGAGGAWGVMGLVDSLGVRPRML
jgi:hypothetical protein